MKTENVPYSIDGKRIWVAGHAGMVGSAILRRLAGEQCEVLTADRTECDLRRQDDVERWMNEARPDAIIIAAATVGGIFANDSRPAEFIFDNLAIETNIIHTAHTLGVGKLLFLGSACVYPREAPQPMAEEFLLSGPLEPTNQWYAVAKIAGIKMCQAYRRQYGSDFISAMPNNLYGVGDNFDAANSHVIPGLMRKFHEAKLTGSGTVTLWGTGTPLREFLYVDDLADALVFLLQNYSDESHVNIGTGEEVTILELATLIAEIVGWDGKIEYDRSKPDGVPRKILDVTKLTEAGWSATTSLREGLTKTYQWMTERSSDELRGLSA